MSERIPEQQQDNPAGFDRCVASIEGYLVPGGQPLRYDAYHQTFARTEDHQDCDALARVVSVDVRDVSIADFNEPILYDAMIFTSRGAQAAGLIASLAQALPALNKTVYLEFTMDKKVRRRTMSAEYVETVEDEISQAEVDILAEQLATIGSPSRPLT